MKPLLVSSGEPAGIGPDLCLELADSGWPLVVLGDRAVLEARASILKRVIHFIDYQPNQAFSPKPGCLCVLSIPCPELVICGKLNPANAAYVIDMLTTGAKRCNQGEFSALVTAPVHKANINAAGITFTGHTEFFAQYFSVDTVVMLLACDAMKVALVTTHLPLRQVAETISNDLIQAIIRQLHRSLREDFNIPNPLIKVAGLNPHAGESGYLGHEELDIINPALATLAAEGIRLQGPFPADTLFVPEGDTADAYLAMYHDQGLAVLKYASFNKAVNITLGLPIIRTSVDHGTALDLAGTGGANAGSLLAALDMAGAMVQNRIKTCNASV